MLHPAFTADDFSPTKFETAEIKAKFANHFLLFVSRDFPKTMFTSAFYRTLHSTFGHIAHYDQAGFWAEFFTTTEDKIRFLDETLRYPCWGDPTFTFSDVEKAIIARLRSDNPIQKLIHRRDAMNTASEKTELQRLMVKYPEFVRSAS
jgi:hypothetical protein